MIWTMTQQGTPTGSPVSLSATFLIWFAIQVENSSLVKKEEHGVVEEIRGDSKV